MAIKPPPSAGRKDSLILEINAKPGAKIRKVEKTGENQYKVWVREVPEKGRANEAIIEVLSEYLKLPKSRLSVVSGHGSKHKRVEWR